jgi:hypothetical protein
MFVLPFNKKINVPPPDIINISNPRNASIEASLPGNEPVPVVIITIIRMSLDYKV